MSSPTLSCRPTALVWLALLLLVTGTSTAQVMKDHIAHLPRASHVIIPQCHGFPLHPNRAQIEIAQVEAKVVIREQTARTTLDIHLKNPGSQQAEAVLLLPVPDGSVVSSFLFEGSASEPTAKVMPASDARRMYNEIIRKVRDPALLEFAGYNLIRSSVFPVPANGTQRVRISYDHLLSAVGERVDYFLPRSESLERRAPWKISVEIESNQPISTIYSPTHEIVTIRPDAKHATVQLTDAATLEAGTFLLSYLHEGDGVSASLFAYPDPKVGGGYFLLMAGLPASIEDAPNQIRREVTVVIDRSGSMAGEKMDQVRAAALQVIEGLADGEAFNIIDYATTVSSFAPEPVVKNDETTKQARAYLAAIRPQGGTNIHDALIEALRAEATDGMLPIVLFLTDGLPTVGQTSEVAIRELVEKGNSRNRRIFTFGVGNDVNVPLLDRVAETSRGTSEYILPNEDIEVKVAQVYKRLYGPVLADVKLNVTDTGGNVTSKLVRELIPDRLPDLFDGDQLILLGQYQDAEAATFHLTGNFLGKQRTFDFTFNLAEATTKNAFVPRLWASRRIAYLVDQIRQAGAAVVAQPTARAAPIVHDPRYAELVNEIVRLSTEFGILTEYTAFLATEGTNLNNWNELIASCGYELNTKAVHIRSGIGAVNQAKNFNFQKGQTVLNRGNAYWNDQLQREANFNSVQQISDRAFFHRGDRWIDSRLVSNNITFAPMTVIKFGSDDHLHLLEELIRERRQGVLSLQGDIELLHQGRHVLITNDDC